MMSFKGNPALQAKTILKKKKKKKQDFSVDKMIFEKKKYTEPVTDNKRTTPVSSGDRKHTDLLSDNRRHSSLRMVNGKHCFRNYGEGDRCLEDNLPFLEDEDYKERLNKKVKQAVYESEIEEIMELI